MTVPLALDNHIVSFFAILQYLLQSKYYLRIYPGRPEAPLIRYGVKIRRFEEALRSVLLRLWENDTQKQVKRQKEKIIIFLPRRHEVFKRFIYYFSAIPAVPAVNKKTAFTP